MLNGPFFEFSTDCDEAPHLAAGERSDVNFAQGHPLRVLVAEDNYINRQLLLAMLRGLGYEAYACENGRESYAVALLGNFDVLLEDLDMVEMSGVECTQRLREAGEKLTIIAMTSSLPELSRNQCLDAGMEGYLMKPVSLGDLKRVLSGVHATRSRREILVGATA